MNGELMLFGYQSESDGLAKIRVIDDRGQPWFVAVDVCNVLGIDNTSGATSRLDPDERQTASIPDSLDRDRDTTLVSESGLYSLVFASRKPEAKRFRRWVTGEVLPLIRRTGRYVAATAEGEAPPQIDARALNEAQTYPVERTDPGTAAITRYRDLRCRRVRLNQKVAKAQLDLAELRRQEMAAVEAEMSASVDAARVLGGYPSPGTE